MDKSLAAITVEVSARHLHLSQADQDALFGPGYEMKKLKDLSQTGQWAADETVMIKGPKGQLKARFLGPCRKQTQVELARTDCFALGVKAELRLSGDLKGTPGCTIVGPKGSIDIPEGVIVPLRHIHISDTEAAARGMKTGDRMTVKVEGARAVTFHEVHVRVDPTFRMAMHLDTDEGNSIWADMAGAKGEIME
ncbi:MAG TPA: phosphate propanoyltransferase [Candidatus Eisenbacteria bacterium]|jgi:propanediol utilization protein|nr:phosphate propanoyltransferase [Candidatus Eisenbacteria bacterium]